MKIPITQIQIQNPIRIDSGNLQELSENIRQFGLLHPIVVQSISKGSYQLIAGFRRMKACESLGWTEIPVTIINPGNELRKLDTTLHENLRRKDLNFMELAEAILDRRKYWEQVHGPIEMGRPQTKDTDEKSVDGVHTFIQDTSKICKMDSSLIYKLLKLNELDTDLKEKVRERKLPYRKALTMQGERKREKNGGVQKTNPKSTGGMRVPSFPNSKEAMEFTNQFKSAPNLAQLFFLIHHFYCEIQKFKDHSFEWQYLNLEYGHFLSNECSEVLQFLKKINEEINRTQEKLLVEMKV